MGAGIHLGHFSQHPEPSGLARVPETLTSPPEPGAPQPRPVGGEAFNPLITGLLTSPFPKLPLPLPALSERNFQTTLNHCAGTDALGAGGVAAE